MIGKFRSENISRRGALLGFPVAFGLAAAPTVQTSSDTDVQMGTAAPGRRKVALAYRAADRTAHSLGVCLTASWTTPQSTSLA
jgi:hypothetical protein